MICVQYQNTIIIHLHPITKGFKDHFLNLHAPFQDLSNNFLWNHCKFRLITYKHKISEGPKKY